MRAASWSVSVVSSPASPGATIFGPARETREEMRLDEARGDADVGLRPLAVEPHRDVGAEAAHPGQRRLVARVVIDDANRREHLVAEHRAQLLVGVAAVRARGDQHDDVLQAHEAVELLEDGRHDDLPRLRPRAVADADRDGAAAAHDVAQRRPGDRSPQRLAHRGALVGGRLRVQRLDDRRAVVRQVDGEAVAPVRELDLHDRRASNSGGVKASIAGSGPS